MNFVYTVSLLKVRASDFDYEAFEDLSFEDMAKAQIHFNEFYNFNTNIYQGTLCHIHVCPKGINMQFQGFLDTWYGKWLRRVTV